MNLEQLTNHLNEFHRIVISVMSPIVGITPTLSPIEIIIRRLFVSGCIDATADLASFVIYINNWLGLDEKSPSIYTGEEVTAKEFTVAHETGHYFHFQNLEMRRISPKHEDDRRKNKRVDRIINYNELTAEFFVCCYFDETEGIEEFFSGRGAKEHGGAFVNDVHDIYMSISPREERKEMTKWLVTHSYDYARRKLKGSPTLDAFRNIVVEI